MLTEPIIYIDRSDIEVEHMDDLRSAIEGVVAFVKQREPQLIHYGFFVDGEAGTMTVLAVHPNSASLELHLTIGGPEFAKVGRFIRLREIEVFGKPDEHVVKLLHEKAERLGPGAAVLVHEEGFGFARP